jgi:hypothetical protein
VSEFFLPHSVEDFSRVQHFEKCCRIAVAMDDIFVSLPGSYCRENAGIAGYILLKRPWVNKSLVEEAFKIRLPVFNRFTDSAG